MPVRALPAGEKRVRVPGGDTFAQTPFRIQPGAGVVIIVVITVGINYYRPRSPLPERRRRESSEVRVSAGQEDLCLVSSLRAANPGEKKAEENYMYS
ncbi:unnamed protein product [Coccothraustes coccothraustes]